MKNVYTKYKFVNIRGVTWNVINLITFYRMMFLIKFKKGMYNWWILYIFLINPNMINEYAMIIMNISKENDFFLFCFQSKTKGIHFICGFSSFIVFNFLRGAYWLYHSQNFQIAPRSTRSLVMGLTQPSFEG